ncbi:hypothetical protein J2S74_005391 [Evansella vedderi]|uniref:Phage protein n=1 Tax=Evansella vedderi TaxID=38282 RepID=A0ABU0A357_9BACI|nr:hypothetical protein [Evansella vedderi]MDQ0257928.1 hypothetical protein [Evansella vedderi]
MKYIIVSEKRNVFYNLSDLIPEFMRVEGKTEQEAIDYFMEGLEGTRYMKFPKYTSALVIADWITQDMDIEVNQSELQ